MSKKKMVVCGASGFIGRNVFETFSGRNEWIVSGVSNSRDFGDARVARLDLTRLGMAETVFGGADVIVHAAAVTSGARDIVTRPYIHVTDNMAMNARVLQAAFEAGVKHFIFLSCTVLYPMNLGRPAREDDFDPDLIHEKYFGGAWVKIAGEKLCEFYARLGRTKFTIIRHSNVYGPHDKYDLERSHVFGATVRKVVDAPEGGTITVWGDGSEERDLVYVSDLVRFIAAALKNQESRCEIFNVGLGRSAPVSELADKIVRASGKKLMIRYDSSRPTIKSALVLDISKAQETLDWRPEVSLEEGIRRTIAWYEENGRRVS